MGLVVLGTVTYFILFVPLSVRELRPFLGKNAEIRVWRARRLTLVPYLTSGLLSCVAGALNPVGPLLILISVAAASFGGNSRLAWMWNLLHGPRIPSRPSKEHNKQHIASVPFSANDTNTYRMSIPSGQCPVHA